MTPRRRLPGTRLGGALLGLLGPLLLACPQLLSDEFHVQLGSTPDPDGVPDLLDASRDNRTGDATAGAAGSTASPLPSTEFPPNPLETPGSGGTGGDPDPPDAGSVIPPDPQAPAVVSVTPSTGAIGVAKDAVVTLTFSEPMNRDSVELAYSSADLPASSVSFDWFANDTLLRITSDQPLTLATGSQPSTTAAARYAFEIGSAAVDLEGEALPPFSSSFFTLRELTQTLAAVQNRSLTGNWRSDDTFGTNDCAQSGSISCVGDSSNGNSTYRGFVTFDLSQLPAGARDVSAAQLRLSIATIVDSPFSDLGSVGVEHVSFASIGLQAFQAAALGSLIGFTGSQSQGGQLRADVSAAAGEDLLARGLSQYRMRFTIPTDTDGDADIIESDWSTQELVITYLVP